jgi:hypothetical protein
MSYMKEIFLFMSTVLKDPETFSREGRYRSYISSKVYSAIVLTHPLICSRRHFFPAETQFSKFYYLILPVDRCTSMRKTKLRMTNIFFPSLLWLKTFFFQSHLSNIIKNVLLMVNGYIIF